MSFVYFARAADLIWIGTTQNPHNPPAVLGYMKGGEVEAMAVRQKFAHLAHPRRGGAFKAAPELLAFIEQKCERPEVKHRDKPEPTLLPRINRRDGGVAMRLLRTLAKGWA